MAHYILLTHSTDATRSNVKPYMSYEQATHGMMLRAYEILEAFGKLDTQAAHNVMAAIDRGEAVVEISNTGYSLTRS
jgi:hypothetical protein